MKDLNDVLEQFSPVLKLDEIKKQRLLHLENSFKVMASDIVEYCSNNRQRRKALEHLLQAKFVATQSITHHKEEQIENKNGTKK